MRTTKLWYVCQYSNCIRNFLCQQYITCIRWCLLVICIPFSIISKLQYVDVFPFLLTCIALTTYLWTGLQFFLINDQIIFLVPIIRSTPEVVHSLVSLLDIENMHCNTNIVRSTPKSWIIVWPSWYLDSFLVSTYFGHFCIQISESKMHFCFF